MMTEIVNVYYFKYGNFYVSHASPRKISLSNSESDAIRIKDSEYTHELLDMMIGDINRVLNTLKDAGFESKMFVKQTITTTLEKETSVDKIKSIGQV
jgi:hypothetical protein